MTSSTGSTSPLWRYALAARLALRDLHGGLKGFRIFIACIALGVAAIAGVASTTRGLSESLAQEGRRILGGDLSFRIIHREWNVEERQWISARGRVSPMATMRAMARHGTASPALVEVKAVADNYPVLGAVTLEPAKASLTDALALRDGVYGIAAEPALLARLGLKVGDRLQIGDMAVQLRAIVRAEPDKLSSGLNLGPRVIMSLAAIRSSGLIQPGSLVRWTYRLLLPESSAGKPATLADVRNVVREARRAFPEAGWRIRTRARVSPGFSRGLDRFTQFLTLVGLTALIVGGVGVANAVRGYIERKQADFAVLKALGASGGYVFASALFEVLLATAIGIAIGIAAGILLPFAMAGLFGSLLPIPFNPAIYPGEIATACLFGIFTALTFSLLPLGYIHDTPVSSLFRDQIDSHRRRLRKRYAVSVGIVIAFFIAAILITATDRYLASIYLGITLLALVILRFVGWLIVSAARKAPRLGSTELRYAVANIHRPGALTHSIVLSLGTGLTLLVALTMIDGNVRQQLQEGIPGKTPSFFFIDIRSDQVDRFRNFLKDKAPSADVEQVPMIRGRVVRVKGVPAGKVKHERGTGWVLRGDRGITYDNNVPDGSKLVEGKWWSADYKGPPLVSLEADIARGIGLEIGDTITLNVLGRNITAKVANLREVNWRSFGINFVFVFNPGAFAGAPVGHIATATFPEGDRGKEELRLLREVADAFPSVTSIRVKETLDAVSELSRQLGYAIRGATVIALLASILVLAGALSAGQRSRIYDSVILKVLGARRRTIMTAMLAEYSILGLATALFATFAGALAAWIIMTFVMRFTEFRWLWEGALLSAGLGLMITISLGLLNTWRILGHRPASHLRTL